MPTPRKGLPKRRPSLRRRKTLALMKAQRQLLIMPFLPSRHRPLRRYPHHPQRSLRTTTIQPIPCQLQAPTASQPAAHPAVAASRIIQVSFVLPVALAAELVALGRAWAANPTWGGNAWIFQRSSAWRWWEAL